MSIADCRLSTRDTKRWILPLAGVKSPWIEKLNRQCGGWTSRPYPIMLEGRRFSWYPISSRIPQDKEWWPSARSQERCTQSSGRNGRVSPVKNTGRNRTHSRKIDTWVPIGAECVTCILLNRRRRKAIARERERDRLLKKAPTTQLTEL